MESMGAFPEGEWEFYNRMFSMEESDFSAEILGQFSFPNDVNEGSQAGYTYQNHHDANYDTLVEGGNLSLCHFGNSLSDSNLTNYTNRVLTNPSSCQESYFSNEFNFASTDFSTVFSQLLPNVPIGETTTYTIDHPPGNEINCDDGQLEMKLCEPEPKTSQPNQGKKRPRVANDAEKKKRNVRSKKGSKLTPTPPNHEDHQESLSNYSSEDENGSQDSNEALNPSGKARASRGSATDPQSLYARKRRERINERLRILQNLVPNGTKVDISTMLEEAVHYVKFLQLQIKLLSSDDLWMFAPIAHNGIDIGLNQRISMLL